MKAKIGYARVSSTGQSLDVQIAKLKEYGCTHIYKEKKTGTNMERPELEKALSKLREGEVFVVTRIDRLARSMMDLSAIAHRIESEGADLVVLDQSAVDTTQPTGKLLFNILGAVAEFETDLRKERQAEGIAKAMEKGVKFGAKAKLSQAQIAEMAAKRESGVKVADLMEEYDISRSSLYRLIDEYKVAHGE